MSCSYLDKEVTVGLSTVTGADPQLELTAQPTTERQSTLTPEDYLIATEGILCNNKKACAIVNVNQLTCQLLKLTINRYNISCYNSKLL